MSGIALHNILEANKLTGPNYNDWLRNVKMVLAIQKVAYVLETPLPVITEQSTANERAQADQWKQDELLAKCIILSSMSNELQRQHESLDSCSIMLRLKELYAAPDRTVRYEISKELFGAKMKEGDSVQIHVLKMIDLIERLAQLGFVMDHELSVDLVLQSLPTSYAQFVLNFNMNKLEATLPELLNMLRTAENSVSVDKGKTIMMVNSSKSAGKSNGTKKNKKLAVNKKNMKAKRKAKKSSKAVSKTGDKCYECGNTGHWKRNCKIYLEKIKKAGPSGVYIVEINISSRDSLAWVLDTGCVSHICISMQGLKNPRRLAKGDVDLRVGNKARVAALAVGTYEIQLPTGKILELRNCYFVPALSRNLISISALCRTGFIFTFNDYGCSFSFKDELFGTGTLNNDLYFVNTLIEVYNVEQPVKRKRDDVNETYLWHCRLGHIGETRLSKLYKERLIEPDVYETYPTCEPCLKGKMTKAPFTGTGVRANELLELVHTDVCGPMSTNAKGGYSYFITFTDDFSRYGYVYLMKYKSESFEKFKEYRSEVEKQIGKSIKTLRSDRGGEYLSTEFTEYLKENGILSQWTPPHTPQLNGVSERRNRTLLDMVRSMMSHTTLPISFWGYALETAIHILNRVPSKSVDTTPYEIWRGRKPSLKFVKIWGCHAYVKKQNPDKLETRSEKCDFIGYPKEGIGYYFWHPQEQKVFVARNAVFLEKEFMLDGCGNEVDFEEVQEPRNNIDPVCEPELVVQPQVPQSPRRSTRERKQPDRLVYMVDENQEVQVIADDEPTSYMEAIQSSDSGKWLEAMISEMESMSANEVWDLVDAPEGINPIGCKWVFKKKIGADGNVETYKSRLVAKGFRQKQGIDYDETFSPVAMLKSIRILLAIAAYYDYEIWQMDVKTAFLNGHLDEDVYMTQPEGFISSGSESKVCKLKKSIYGLKQASRSWNIRFDETVKMFDFIKNEDEPCVYKKVSGNAITFLILYVDDILIIGNDIPVMQSVKLWLSQQFSMKDLGEASYVLGIKIYRDRSKRMIGLSQSNYIDRVLKRFSMENSKKGFLPYNHGIHLSKGMAPKTPEERDRMKNIPYASAIGSIMYAMLCTRPDVAYALGVASRYQSDPGESHWTAVKSILKYLRRTKDLFLIYGGESELKVEGHTDSSFQSDRDDSKSVSGYVFTLNGGAVSWKSSKQQTVADSTTEAEYIAASEAAKEAVWMKKFITELGVVPGIEDPIPLLCDNNGAIAQAKEPRSHQKSKHILRRFHLIREIIERGEIMIQKVDTKDNIADPFTKALSQKLFENHFSKMGVRREADWL